MKTNSKLLEVNNKSFVNDEGKTVPYNNIVVRLNEKLVKIKGVAGLDVSKDLLDQDVELELVLIPGKDMACEVRVSAVSEA